MRKFFSIGLIFMHLLSGVGVFATVHYCGNTITQWSWIEEETDNCSCDRVKREDCCSDVRIQSQVISESTAAQSLKIERKPVKQLFQVFAQPVYSFATANAINVRKLTTSDPGRPGSLSMLRHTVLRI